MLKSFLNRFLDRQARRTLTELPVLTGKESPQEMAELFEAYGRGCQQKLLQEIYQRAEYRLDSLVLAHEVLDLLDEYREPVTSSIVD